MKPFLLGRKTLAIDSLHAPSGFVSPHALTGAPARSKHPPADPSGATVEVVKEGDKVMRLIVRCSCGECIEIDCLYPVGS